MDSKYLNFLLDENEINRVLLTDSAVSKLQKSINEKCPDSRNKKESKK